MLSNQKNKLFVSEMEQEASSIISEVYDSKFLGLNNIGKSPEILRERRINGDSYETIII